MKQEIIIEIAPDGTIKMTTHGLKGAECEDELKPMEKALGKVTARTRTSEFFEAATSRGKIKTSTK